MLKGLKKDFSILLLLSFWCIVLVFVRIYITGSNAFLFMVYNLFLAWIPVVLAVIFKNYIANYTQKKLSKNTIIIIIFISWLLFLPNTFYIFTDLFHIPAYPINKAPWFNLIFLLTFSLNGLFLGIVSLKIVSNSLSHLITKYKIIIFETTVLLLSSYGVYLGRYLRWNSWDILVNPVGLFVDGSQAFFNPSALGMILVFFVMLQFCYFFYTDYRGG